MNRPLTPTAKPSSGISLQDSFTSRYLLNSDVDPKAPLGNAVAHIILALTLPTATFLVMSDVVTLPYCAARSVALVHSSVLYFRPGIPLCLPPRTSHGLPKAYVGSRGIHVRQPDRAPLFFHRVRFYNAGGFGPMKYGRIISLSSCSTMWQCQTYNPERSNKALTRVISPG